MVSKDFLLCLEVIEDLENLKLQAEELVGNLKEGGTIPTKKYLQLECLHILTLSKFEYLLKSLGRINKQFEITDCINGSKCLTRLEKDHLIYLYLIRHTIVHYGGCFDEDFFKGAKKEIKELNLEIPKDGTSRSPVYPSLLMIYIDLIEKVIRVDILGVDLNSEE